MRARAAFVAGAGSAAIVAVGCAIGAGALAGGTASAGGSTNTAATSAAGITGTFHGNDVPDDAGYGDVQVDVVFENGKITDVVFVNANATNGRSQAFPMLKQETLSAQSAKVSNIGGATYTSDAYMRSVQSALDAAGFKG